MRVVSCRLTPCLSPLGDETAPFSAAGQSAERATNEFISPQSFGCGCATLSC
jgi:hypothetical protein